MRLMLTRTTTTPFSCQVITLASIPVGRFDGRMVRVGLRIDCSRQMELLVAWIALKRVYNLVPRKSHNISSLFGAYSKCDWCQFDYESSRERNYWRGIRRQLAVIRASKPPIHKSKIEHIVISLNQRWTVEKCELGFF